MSQLPRTPVRENAIDYLKIMATFLIVIGHFVPKYLWNGSDILCGYMIQYEASTDPNTQVMVFYNSLSHLGNDLFLLCSAWFLLDSRKCKPRRILALEWDLIILGALWLAITILFGHPLQVSYVRQNLLPVSSYTYWFFTCYILFYFLHPAYNAVLDNLDKKQLLTAVLILLSLYSIMQLAERNYMYFNPLVGFTTIYFCAAYNKRYLSHFSQNRRANAWLFLICTLLLILFHGINQVIGLRVPGYRFEMEKWNHYMNLFIIGQSFGLFNLFRTFSFPVTALVQKLSGLSLIIYVLTESPYMRFYFKPWLYDWIYGRFDYDYVWLYVLVCSIVAYIVAATAGLLYQFLFRPLREKSQDLLTAFGSKVGESVLTFFLQCS